jgi:hypothetical protein
MIYRQKLQQSLGLLAVQNLSASTYNPNSISKKGANEQRGMQSSLSKSTSRESFKPTHTSSSIPLFHYLIYQS